MGTLFVCGTPIGNLEDITLRVLRILKEVDFIACEDTRHSLKLLNHYDIHKPLVAYHHHNRFEKTSILLDRIQNGENMAYISDAGMPCISDPGELLVKEANIRKIDVQIIPGPSAFITGLVYSGFSSDKFLFYGFLSSKNSERKKELSKLKNENNTIIFYEAPHRFLKTIKCIGEIFSNRKIAVCRELTKRYEELFVGNSDEILNHFSDGIKGEIVILIEKKDEETIKLEKDERLKNISPIEEMKKLIIAGLSEKEAMKQIAKEREMKKNEIYKLWVEEKEK